MNAGGGDGGGWVEARGENTEQILYRERKGRVMQGYQRMRQDGEGKVDEAGKREEEERMKGGKGGHNRKEGRSAETERGRCCGIDMRR
jgi:hypothetical protein